MNREASGIPPAAPPAPVAARVIRGGADAKVEPLYPATRLLKGAVLDAQRAAADAKRLLEKARADAAAIRKPAVDEADAGRRDAFERGSERAAAELAQTLRNFGTELERLKGQFARDAQRVAFKLARMILDVELAVRPERIVDLVASVLGRAKLYERIALHLHPDDVDRVRPHQAALTRELAFAREIQLCADAELPPHGVRVETEMGIYDGSIDVQLKRLRAHLLGPAAADDGEPTSPGSPE
jgi:flagellar biosynthesis/type III secretory pathway protein FliH